jgi:hypothetical protein
VDAKATVVSSIIGPNTYVGPKTEIRYCIAAARNLVNWRTSTSVVAPARFLLSELHKPQIAAATATLMARLAALFMMSLTLPIATCIALRSWLVGQPAFRLRKAVPARPGGATARSILYYELLHTNRCWKRWPQLWNIFQGEFSWVGNRPLTASQANRLGSDFEKLWLETSIGVVSLADAEGCIDAFDDEARAHASFYAAKASTSLRFSILIRVLGAALTTPPVSGREEEFAIPVVEPVVKHQGEV